MPRDLLRRDGKVRSLNRFTAHMSRKMPRKGKRGVPPCVLQQEVEKKSDLKAVRGTVKAAMLKGDPGCPCLVASSVHNWIVKERKVWNSETCQMEWMRHLRLNHVDTHNNKMGNTDVADQLRVFHCLDHWVRDRKWWWAAMFWAPGTMLTD